MVGPGNDDYGRIRRYGSENLSWNVCWSSVCYGRSTGRCTSGSGDSLQLCYVLLSYTGIYYLGFFIRGVHRNFFRRWGGGLNLLYFLGRTLETLSPITLISLKVDDSFNVLVRLAVCTVQLSLPAIDRLYGTTFSTCYRRNFKWHTVINRAFPFCREDHSKLRIQSL